jgi:hypothetical protein
MIVTRNNKVDNIILKGEDAMKKILIGLMALGSISAFAGNPIHRKEVRILSFEERSFGAVIKVQFDSFCDDSVGGPFCFGETDKIKKETLCNIENGVLIANVKITHLPSNWGNTLNRKRKDVKIKFDGLCQEGTPQALIVNSHQIY